MISTPAIRAFVKSRDEAYTRFTMYDDWGALKAHLRRYRQWQDRPRDKRVLAAAIYKGVQECTNIPDEVKDVAKEKCIALGFEPYMPGHSILNNVEVEE